MLRQGLWIATGALLIAALATTVAQVPMDLSGRWHATPEIQPAGSAWAPGPDLLITQQSGTLTVTALTAGRRQSTFRLDGSPTEGIGTGGQRVTTIATWTQTALVIVATDASSRTTTSYALNDQRRLVVTSTATLLNRADGTLTVSTTGQTRRVYMQVGSASAAAQLLPSLKVGFRYDDSRVLFYAGKRQDPLKQDFSSPLPAPRARYGAGGYLLPLTPDRLAGFRPGPGHVPPIGTTLTVMLGGAREVTAVVDTYVEQWGAENPVVGIGVLAHVPSSQLQTLRAAASDYFLIRPRAPEPPDPRPSPPMMSSSTPQVVNRFGPLGDLVVQRAPAGWCVDLAVPHGGVPPAVITPYCYGD